MRFRPVLFGSIMGPRGKRFSLPVVVVPFGLASSFLFVQTVVRVLRQSFVKNPVKVEPTTRPDFLGNGRLTARPAGRWNTVVN